MAGLLADVCRTADLKGACVRAGVSLVELRIARSRDLAFDQSMVIADQCVRLAVIDGLTASAAAGDLRAAKLLAQGLGDLLSRPMVIRVEAAGDADGGPGPAPTPTPSYLAEELRAKGECPYCHHWFDVRWLPAFMAVETKGQGSEWAGRRGADVGRHLAVDSRAQPYWRCSKCGTEEVTEPAVARWQCRRCGNMETEPLHRAGPAVVTIAPD